MAPLFAVEMPLSNFFGWLFLVWSLGWLALPVTRRIWSVQQQSADNIQPPTSCLLLSDAGLAVGRILFLCLWTLCSLWLGFAGVPVRFCALLIYGFAALLLFFAWRERADLKILLQNQRRGIIASELIFVVVFLFFFVVRGFWSSIENGEKPMDMALISAIARADFLPPPNPYAAGERLASYYYLGHLQMALLTDAIGAEPRWTYNLMAATLPALCFSVLASLCAAFTGRVRYGAIAAFLVLAGGTQEAWRQWTVRWLEARHGGAPFSWWPINYWDTSRVIPYMAPDGPHFSINEYPWFTFNYADLHAHYFDQPLALLIIALAWALFHQVGATFTARKLNRLALLGAVVIGAQIMTNTWDVPAYFLLLISAFIWAERGHLTDIKNVAGGTPTLHKSLYISGIGIIALIVAAPFLLHLHSEANPPKPLEQPASPLNEWLLVWGSFVLAWGATLTFKTGRRTAKIIDVIGLLCMALPWLKMGQPCAVLSLILLLLVWTAFSAWKSEDTTHTFLCRIALCGLIALLWSETTWAGFLDKPNHRQDTLFKFGLQVWYLLGTAAVCGAIRLLHDWSARRPLALPFLRAALCIFLYAPLVATLSTVLARSRSHLMSREETLVQLGVQHNDETTRPVIFNGGAFGFYSEKWDAWDAWAHLTPPQKDAAQWLYNEAHDGDHLLEAEQKEGGDYSEYTRFAHASGVPTVIGPQAHTFQWGVSWEKVFERKNDVRLFYLSGNLNRRALRRDLIKKYHLRFIVLGGLERKEYGTRAIAWLERDLLHDGWTLQNFAARDGDEERVTIFYQPR